MRLETPKWNEVPKWWPAIEGWVASALEHGGVTLYPVDVYNGLTSRNMKLWLALDGSILKACCVTRIANYPRLKSLDILICSGSDSESWLGFYPAIEQYAKANDCDAVEFYGRRGWEKKMSGWGFKPVISIFRKAI